MAKTVTTTQVNTYPAHVRNMAEEALDYATTAERTMALYVTEYDGTWSWVIGPLKSDIPDANIVYYAETSGYGHFTGFTFMMDMEETSY